MNNQEIFNLTDFYLTILGCLMLLMLFIEILLIVIACIIMMVALPIVLYKARSIKQIRYKITKSYFKHYIKEINGLEWNPSLVNLFIIK